MTGAPEKLTAAHDLTTFDSGETVLDEWLRTRALDNQSKNASRTYVVCLERRVVGFYALAVGAITHEKAPGRIKRNMPDPVPVMLLGQLAVDRSVQGQGIGAGLWRDAILRTVQAAEIAGLRVILAHAISDNAKRFYEGNGFIASPLDPLMLMMNLRDALKMMGERRRK